MPMILFMFQLRVMYLLIFLIVIKVQGFIETLFKKEYKEKSFSFGDVK